MITLFLILVSAIVRINVVDSAYHHLRDAEIAVEAGDSVFYVVEGDGFAVALHKLSIHIFVPGFSPVVETVSVQKDTTFTFILTQKVYTAKEVEVVSSPLPAGDVKVGRYSMINMPSPIAPDPLRPIANLPFVEVTNELLPFSFYVKGGVSGENSVFIEGYPLVFPFHFGFKTAVPIHALDSYDFYTISIPPEFALRVSSAINFHLRRDKADELFLDPLSSISFIHSRENLLSSFRFTSMSLPLYYSTGKKSLYYYGDIIQRFHNLFFYTSYDYSYDGEAEYYKWYFLNLVGGARFGKSRIYISSGKASIMSVHPGDSSREGFLLMTLGFISKPLDFLGMHIRLADFKSYFEGIEWVSSCYKLLMADVWLHKKYRIFNITSAVKIIRDSKWRIFPTPRLEVSSLKNRNYYKFSIGRDVQTEISEFGDIIGVIRPGDITKNYFIQFETGREKWRFGAFIRYYPHEYYFVRLAKEDTVFEGNDTLFNIVSYDSLFDVRKKVGGLYFSFSILKDFWTVSGDVAYQRGIQYTDKISFPIPYMSSLSFKVMPGIRWGKNLLNLLIYFKSGIVIPSFYDIENGHLVTYKEPREFRADFYLRLDLGFSRAIKFFRWRGKIILGVFNLIGIKPDLTYEYGEDAFLKFPIPSAGLWLKL